MPTPMRASPGSTKPIRRPAQRPRRQRSPVGRMRGAKSTTSTLRRNRPRRRRRSRGRVQRQAAHRARRRSPGKSDADPRRVARLPRRDDGEDQRQERSRRRHPLCHVALGGPDALHRRRPPGNVEQRRRARDQPFGSRKEDYLFAGSDEGGRRATVMYTPI